MTREPLLPRPRGNQCLSAKRPAAACQRRNRMIRLENIQGATERHYVHVWIHALGILLGWSKARVLKWADRWREELYGKEDAWALLHKDPLDYVAEEIARFLDGDAQDLERVWLDHRIKTELVRDGSWRADWDLLETRDRVSAIALEYDATLPRPRIAPDRPRTTRRRCTCADPCLTPQFFLLAAIADGGLTMLRRELQNGADIEGFGETNWTPLQHAVRHRRKDSVACLIELGSKVDARSRDGRGITALMLSAEKGDDQILSLLLHAGAKVNLADEEGRTALHYAAANCHLDAVNLLIGHHASAPRSASEIRSLLFIPALRGRPDVIQAIGGSGADFSECGDLLTMAAGNGDIESITFLLEQGVDVNGAGHALIHAAAGNHETIVRMLLAAGADLTATLRNKTAIQWAREHGHRRIVKILAAAQKTLPGIAASLPSPAAWRKTPGP
jgi:ankyrin repeat protein